MKTVKSLLLGTAAVVVGAVAAQAADLAAPEPVEYVRVCDAYGAGFFFIPGTDTCLKVSGYVRAYYGYESNHYNRRAGDLVNIAEGLSTGAPFAGGNQAGAFAQDPGKLITPSFQTGAILNRNGVLVTPSFGVNGGANFARNGIGAAFVPVAFTWVKGGSPINDQFVMGVRATMRFDARSRTEWGVLRSFFEFAAMSNNFAHNADPLQLRYGFIQFGPVTAGLTDSFFNGDGLNNFFGDNIGDRGDRVPLLAYTASFGNGISATISLEDSTNTWGNGGTNGIIFAQNAGGVTGVGVGENWVRKGVQLPDLIGNLRVSQAWGNAWLSGAVAQARLVNNLCAVSLSGICTTTKTGWAIGGGVTVNLPALARGDNIVVKAAYTDGAVEYLGNGPAFGYWASSVNPITGAAGFDGSVTSVTAWAVTGQFEHYFTPAIRGTVTGAYASISPSLNGALGTNLVYLKDAWMVTGTLNWTPVKNLELGVEIFYNNNGYAAFAGAAGGVGLGPASRVVSTVRDSGWGGVFRVARSF